MVGGWRKKKEVDDLVDGTKNVVGYESIQLAIDCHGKKGMRKDLKTLESVVNVACEEKDEEWESAYAQLED